MLGFLLIALPLACHAAADTVAARWLMRAESAIGLSSANGRVLRIVATRSETLTDESDRSYGPFIVQPSSDTAWLNPTTGSMRTASAGRVYLGSARASFRSQGSTIVPDPRLHSRLWINRAANPWATLLDWAHGSRARVAGICEYRDYPRLVLARHGPFGEEQLYLDRRTAVPVLLERPERHYFLGAIRVQYVYESWYEVTGGGLYPVSTTRLVDDSVADSWFVDAFSRDVDLEVAASVPAITVPDSSLIQAIDPARRFGSDSPDTVPVGAGTYLLANSSFTSVVSLQQDTAFVFDAPAGEDRARDDADWVRRLFPHRRATVLVALNAVWPHIAGLRYWVAQGASVVGSRPVVPYLQKVVNRRWTAAPDDLERVRARITTRFIAVGDSARFAGGRVQLYAMEGINGETVLLAYVAPSRFVWASDHIQVVSYPNVYVDDVRATVRRHALSAIFTSGPHFGVLPWAAIDTLPAVLAQH